MAGRGRCGAPPGRTDSAGPRPVIRQVTTEAKNPMTVTRRRPTCRTRRPPRPAFRLVLAGPRWLSLLLAAVVTLAGCGGVDPPRFLKTRDSNYGQIGDV